MVSDERNPLNTTTYGVGEVIRDAIDKGMQTFSRRNRGSATNDGVRMLQALGYSFLDKDGNQVPFGAKGLKGFGANHRYLCASELKSTSLRLHVM